MQIRPARTEDAAAACDVIRRSIVELCHADHGGDPAALQPWLSNKTPQNVATWIARQDNNVFVAVDGDVILGVAVITDHGEILLNYVSPDARLRGVSKALLAQMEATARQRGNAACTLTSTVTARRFYASAGYVDSEAPDAAPRAMIKRFVAR